MQTWNGRNSIG